MVKSQRCGRWAVCSIHTRDKNVLLRVFFVTMFAWLICLTGSSCCYSLWIRYEECYSLLLHLTTNVIFWFHGCKGVLCSTSWRLLDIRLKPTRVKEQISSISGYSMSNNVSLLAGYCWFLGEQTIELLQVWYKDSK